MDRVRTVGSLLTVLSVAAYVAGILAPYPGREFSLTLFLAGTTLVGVGGAR